MLRITALMGLVGLAGLARAAPPPPPTLPARSGEPGVFLLEGGSTLAGQLVRTGPGGDVLELRSGAVLNLPLGRIVGRVAGPDAWDSDVRPDPLVRLTWRGKTVEGVLVGRERGHLRLRAASGAEDEFDEASITEARFVSELGYRHAEWIDPGRLRYLAGGQPGALGGGEWAVRASAASALEIGYGVRDWLALGAAIETPIYSGAPLPPVGVRLDASTSVRLGPMRVGSGITASRAEDAISLVLHAEVSVGSPRANLTLWAGPPLAGAGRLGSFEGAVVGVSGAYRPLTYLGLVAEAWMSPRRADRAALGALALRLPVRRIALDVGVMGSRSGDVAPWFAITIDGRRTP